MGSWKDCAWGLTGHRRVTHLYPGSSRKPLEDLKLEGRVGNVGSRDEKLRLVFHMAYMGNGLEELRVNPAKSGQIY